MHARVRAHTMHYSTVPYCTVPYSLVVSTFFFLLRRPPRRAARCAARAMGFFAPKPVEEEAPEEPKVRTRNIVKQSMSDVRQTKGAKFEGTDASREGMCAKVAHHEQID